jgi:hypothetical protein
MKNVPPVRDGSRRKQSTETAQKVVCVTSSPPSTKPKFFPPEKASPTRRSRRSAKRKRAPTCRREVAVYDGQDLLGIVKIAGHATAYNPDGKRTESALTMNAFPLRLSSSFRAILTNIARSTKSGARPSATDILELRIDAQLRFAKRTHKARHFESGCVDALRNCP